MSIWSIEIKDLKNLYQTFKGQHPKLDKELDKLTTTDDENMALVYSRRCLEVIITHLCESELKRSRGTEPLKGIIDKLNKEEKVPHNIIVSMQNLNSLSTFGAHPKDFNPRQVKPVLLDLITVLEWYLNHLDSKAPDKAGLDVQQEKRKDPVAFKKATRKQGMKIILTTGGLLLCAIIAVALLYFNIIGNGKKALREPIESIVFLPFSNFTGSDTLDWFVDGMHSSLIGEMSKISGLRTIGPTTSRNYKDVDLSATQIASDANVDALIETDVMCLLDSICLQVKLIIPGHEEKTLLVGKYKEEKSKILNLYSKITKQIAKETLVELTPEELKRFSEFKTVNKEAYDAYLKGQYYWEKLDAESMQKSVDYFELATKIDPEWADPYAGLANAWALFGFYNVLPKSVTLPKAYKYINKAFEFNPNSAKAHYVKAIFTVWTEGEWEQGENEFLISLDLNPNDALARLYYAHLLMMLRRSDEAVHQANLGLEVDPLKPIVLGLYGVVMENEGDYQTAKTSFEKALSIDSNFRFAANRLMTVQYFIGDYEKWIESWRRKAPWNDEAETTVINVFHEKGHIAAIEEMFKMNEKYGNEDCYMSDSRKAHRYLLMNNYEKALDHFEKAYEMDPTSISYIATRYNYDQLKDNPRYIELLKKMNLPFQ